ncbi:MAG: hypothetical protein JSW60_08770 [Thermoplasmatales archaeon]|nr:MAG: hypothetical protein JSW60_08770 [Thermoplasmatales archaeon]
MVDKGVKEHCPTCGQPMNFVKSEKQQTKMALKDEDRNVKAFDISQIWHCINCSEEWEIDIIRNIWRKSEITK